MFFDGQIYDAFSFIVGLIQKAKKEIILIDNYVDINTLKDIVKFNAQKLLRIFMILLSKMLVKRALELRR